MNICCIFNLAALYRRPIYRLLDERLGCDFYITKWSQDPFKQMDYQELKGYKGSGIKIDLLFGFYWQTKTVSLVMKNYDCYILTGEPYSLSNWLILVICKVLKKNTFVWSHGWYGRESLLKRQIKKWFFGLASGVLLYGDYARSLMINNGLNPNKLFVIYNSLDYKEQIVRRNKLSNSSYFEEYFGNSLPVIIFLGRIQRIKRIDLMLGAIGLLNAQGFGCNLLIVGDEFEDINLDKLVHENKLSSNVWLFGSTYEEQVIGPLIYNAAVTVSPGNVGLTAIHSLTYGTPVITHNNFSNQMPEFEAILDGETGSFFNEDSIEDLAEKVKMWIGISPQKRIRTREACYSVVDLKYNPEAQYNRIVGALNFICKK